MSLILGLVPGTILVARRSFVNAGRTLFNPYFAPQFASLLYAISFVLLWLAILWMLYRRNVILKV